MTVSQLITLRINQVGSLNIRRLLRHHDVVCSLLNLEDTQQRTGAAGTAS